MRTALYVLLALAAPAFAGQTVWKWVDDKGVTHYSDQPVPGATKMELNSSRSDTDPKPSYTPSSPGRDIAPQKGPAYARFVVISPQQDESIINTGGKVTVRLASTPAIGGGQAIAIYLDGARVEGLSPSSMSHDLSDVPRGTHTVKAAVLGQNGAPLQETPPVTFHVRQESVAKPPVGPAMRPPPKPRAGMGNKLRTSQPSYAALNGGAPLMDPRTNRPVPPPKAKPEPVGPKAGK